MLKNPLYLYSTEPNYVPAKLNLGEFLIGRLKKYGNKLAMINCATDVKLKYSEILQASMNVAVSLVKIGVKRGDVVGICTERMHEFWPTVIGLACTGAVTTFFNMDYGKDELRHVINISKPRYLFCSMQTYKAHKAVFKSEDCIEKIIMFSDERIDDLLLYKEFAIVSSQSLISNNVSFEEFEAVEVDGKNDTVFLMYSSGTSGLPKGVMLTHLNAISLYCMSSIINPELRVLNITPWTHAYGLMTNFLYLCHGTEVVYLPKFEMDSFLKCIEKYKAQHLNLVPPIATSLIKTTIKYDLSSVVTILCGAAVLEPKIIDAVKQKFKNLEAFIQGYGMTETTFTVTIDPFYKTGKCNTASVGKVVPDTVIKIVDVVTREPLGSYQHGEVCVKSPTIMKGYHGMDKNIGFDDEGFIRTGDIGYYDEDKYLYIVDRMKELIKYKGYQVPPAEIEAVLLQHHGVLDVGVVGLPDAMAGELPFAFVVPQPGTSLTETELQQYVAERLSKPKHLRGGVQFIGDIPKTGSGKILRRHLLEILNVKKNEDNSQ